MADVEIKGTVEEDTVIAADSKADEKVSDDAPPAKKIKTSPTKEAAKEEVKEEESKKENGKSAEEVIKHEPATQLESKIIQQIEYYFGDANLSRDKFLLNEITKNEGWIPLSVLLTFKRLAALSTDSNVIVAALEKSDECLLQIHEDRTKIRRHPDRPLVEQNEETRKEIIGRTAYIKGFPPQDTEISQLIEFFEPYEKVTNIVMRKYLNKPTKTYKFKGSVFLTFAKKEQCAEFLKKEKLSFGETELIKKWQSEYYEGKKEERQNEKLKNEKLRNNKPDKNEFTVDLPKGAVIHLEGLGGNITREDIKKVISELGGEVAFIDYSKGDKSGHVRLSVENSAKPIVEKLENSKLKIGDVEAAARVIEGDEEKEFLETVVTNMKSRRNQSHQNRHNKGGRHQHHNRKRRNSQTDDGDRVEKQ